MLLSTYPSKKKRIFFNRGRFRYGYGGGSCWEGWGSSLSAISRLSKVSYRLGVLTFWVLLAAQGPAWGKTKGESQLYGLLPTTSFFDNSEYFGPFIQGETLAGFQLHPCIGYQPTSYFVTQGGVFCRRYWGEKQFFSTLSPTFSMLLCITPSFYMTMGGLPTSNPYRLIAPFYNPIDWLVTPPPTGLAFAWKRETGFVHTWLDWRKLLDKLYQKPEIFVAGLSAEQGLFYKGPFHVYTPLQVMVYHRGGQGIAIQDFSLWMGAVGICFGWKKLGPVIRRLTWENYHVQSRYVKPVDRFFKNGLGWLFQLGVHTKMLSLRLAYWEGNGFSSENVGNPLFQSMHIVEGEVAHRERHRRLILLGVDGRIVFGNHITLALRLDPYYDIQHRLLEHAMGLYLHYTVGINTDSK